MKAIIITAIICVTLVMISWINRDRERRTRDKDKGNER
jgi:hypothetical protein